jgi:4-hydroxy-2-oxoheptanedioate aldolase
MRDPFDRSFRDRTLAGETLLGLFLDLGSPASAELCAAAGYDWILVDLEHGAATEADLLGMLQAVEVGGSTPLVRPQSGERLRIGRALDMGARAIMIPRLDSADQAREAVTYLRYPPTGIRGVATRVRGAGLGAVGHADVHRLNDRVVGIVQIESVGGLRDADAIAAIDGVDVLFVGPADLSHSLGIPGQFGHADYLDALDKVVGACRAHGISSSDSRSSGSGRTGRSWRARPSARWRPFAAESTESTRARHLPDQGLDSAARGRAGCGASLGRSAVCATSTPMMMRPAPTSWIGLSTSCSASHARATMISGSTVLTRAAWAAPIRREPA